MAIAEGEVIKWGGGFIAAVLAFFGLKAMVVREIEASLKLKIDLLHAEAKLIEEKNKQTRLDIARLEIEVKLKLDKEAHGLICDKMHQEIRSVKDCIKTEVGSLKEKMNERRKTDGD